MKVGALIELLMELPEDTEVLVKDNKLHRLVPVSGLLDAERLRDGERFGVIRFRDDWTEFWWKGVCTPHDDFGCYVTQRSNREPKRLTSRLTSAAEALLSE